MDKKKSEGVYHQVPLDYYETSYKSNFLQRLWHYRRYQAVRKELRKLPEGSKILDIGCAGGFTLEKCLPKNKKFSGYGVDVTRELIDHAKSRRPQFNFEVAYGENLPFQNNVFDGAMLLDVIEHLVDPQKSLKEALRILKENGLLIVMVAEEHQWFFQIIWRLWKKLKGKVWEDAHLHIFNEKKLFNLVREAGFKNIKIEKTHLGMFMLLTAGNSSSK